MTASTPLTDPLYRDGYTRFMAERYLQADRNTSYFVYGFFTLGILLAFFFSTWVFALGVGGAALAAYLLCQVFVPGTLFSRMVTSLVFSVYMLQFIGQMHGMYEMHFFFFINIAILIIYQDWRVMVPYTLFAILHHAFLFGVQMNGHQVGQYFINLHVISYTVLFFHLGLAALMGVICGWWSLVLQKRTEEDYHNKYTLETQLGNIAQNIAFASEISRGNLSASYALKEGDVLGLSLQEMRSSLLISAQKEEQERYKNVGLTEIGEILRKNSDNLEELANQLISRIVKYMKINQGGLFILKEEDNDSHLELIACYAFDRKKYLSKRIEIGEGLVGQAVLEKDTIYITDVPGDYINISSGLGDARPRSLLIVPLKTSDETVVGIMEFASFHIFQPHEIEFLEKMAETIAAAITTAKVNQRTRLLLERSQQQAEELRAQEEEMRQNMEELEATQEEMRRKEIDMRGQLTSIDNTLATIEFDMQGGIRTANEKFLQTMGYSAEEIRGKHHRMFCDAQHAASSEYKAFWQSLNDGKAFTDDYKRLGKGGKEVWLHASYTPVMDSKGAYYKVIKLAFDITQEKLRNLDAQGQIEAINNANAVMEFSPGGSILRANWIFQDLLGYSESELIGKQHRTIIETDVLSTEAYQQHWASLKEGEVIQGEFKLLTKAGESVWVRGSFNPVFDPNGLVMKVVNLAQNITAEKQLQARAEQQLQALDQKVSENELMRRDLDAYLKALDAAALMSEADVYGNITYVNDRFCEVAKWSREEVLGKPHNILRHPDNPKELFKEMWETIKSGKVFKGRYPNRAKDGSTYWVEATIEPVLDEQGKPVKYIGIRFDITEQVEKEQEIARMLKASQEHLDQIQASEEELRQNIDQMASTQEELERREKESLQIKEELDARVGALDAAALMSESDVYGNIIYVNAKFCEVAKYSADEIIGKPHSILRHPDNPKSLFKEMWETIKDGRIFQGRYPNRAKDGSTYWVEATIVPVMGPDGKPVKYIGIRFDITNEMVGRAEEASFAG